MELWGCSIKERRFLCELLSSRPVDSFDNQRILVVSSPNGSHRLANALLARIIQKAQTRVSVLHRIVVE